MGEKQRQAPRLDRTVKSNFAPFELRIRGSDYDEIERIIVDISVKKTGDLFQVEYASTLRTWSDEVLPPIVSDLTCEESSVTEISNVEEVSQEHLHDYCTELIEKLAGSHADIRNKMVDFFQLRVQRLEQDAVAESSFPPFDVT